MSYHTDKHSLIQDCDSLTGSKWQLLEYRVFTSEHHLHTVRNILSSNSACCIFKYYYYYFIIILLTRCFLLLLVGIRPQSLSSTSAIVIVLYLFTIYV